MISLLMKDIFLILECSLEKIYQDMNVEIKFTYYFSDSSRQGDTTAYLHMIWMLDILTNKGK